MRAAEETRLGDEMSNSMSEMKKGGEQEVGILFEMEPEKHHRSS